MIQYHLEIKRFLIVTFALSLSFLEVSYAKNAPHIHEPKIWKGLTNFCAFRAQDRAESWLRLAPMQHHKAYEVRHDRPTSLQAKIAKKAHQVAIIVHPPFSAIRHSIVSFRFENTEHKLYGPLGAYGRSFLYDNGLLLTFFALKKRCEEGHSVVQTLAHLQQENGSWGFSFDAFNNNFYNVSYLRAGSVAWAGYGLSIFAQRCQSQAALRIATKAASYLESLRVKSRQDVRYGLYRSGKGRWTLDYSRFYAKPTMEVCVSEHQFDIYFFLKRLHKAAHALSSSTTRPSKSYHAQAELLADAILEKLWLKKESRFVMGLRTTGADKGYALDSVGAWGGLFLLARKKQNAARKVAKLIESRFRVINRGILGYRPYLGTILDHPGFNWDQSKTLFLEGTASVSVFYHRLGWLQQAQELNRSLRLAQSRSGGIPYAIGEMKDFPEVPAAAPTIWFLFASMQEENEQSIKNFWTER